MTVRKNICITFKVLLISVTEELRNAFRPLKNSLNIAVKLSVPLIFAKICTQIYLFVTVKSFLLLMLAGVAMKIKNDIRNMLSLVSLCL